MTPPVTTVGDAPEGMVELKVKNAMGRRIGLHQIDAECMDDELMVAIKSWQLRHAGVSLTIIRPSGESA